VHDLDAVALDEAAVGVEAAGDQLFVDFDREALAARGEVRDEVCDRRAGGHLARLAIDLDVHPQRVG
jgi:hypothetical protein